MAYPAEKVVPERMPQRSDIHESFRPRSEVKTASDRSVGLVFSAAFAIIGVWPLFDDREIRYWALGLAIALLVVTYICPAVLKPLNRGWTALGNLLHNVVTPVILLVLFLLAVTPLALVMRLLGKTPMALKFDQAAKSYWIRRSPPGPAPDTMKNQF
jgi:hypothetical protein